MLDFCHIVESAQTVPLRHWLSQRGMEQRRVGLVKIAHARELYALFYDPDGMRGYHGIALKPEALLEKAERLMAEVETAFDASDLPETVIPPRHWQL